MPDAAIGQSVWATLTLTPKDAYLDIYDAAPDTLQRRHFVRHPFPLKEEVLLFPARKTKASQSAPQRRWDRWARCLRLSLAAVLGTMS